MTKRAILIEFVGSGINRTMGANTRRRYLSVITISFAFLLLSGCGTKEEKSDAQKLEGFWKLTLIKEKDTPVIIPKKLRLYQFDNGIIRHYDLASHVKGWVPGKSYYVTNDRLFMRQGSGLPDKEYKLQYHSNKVFILPLNGAEGKELKWDLEKVPDLKEANRLMVEAIKKEKADKAKAEKEKKEKEEARRARS